MKTSFNTTVFFEMNPPEATTNTHYWLFEITNDARYLRRTCCYLAASWLVAQCSWLMPKKGVPGAGPNPGPPSSEWVHSQALRTFLAHQPVTMSLSHELSSMLQASSIKIRNQ